MYFFFRLLDSATVVYKVAVKDGNVTSVRLAVYHGEGSQDEPDEQRWILELRATVDDPAPSICKRLRGE